MRLRGKDPKAATPRSRFRWLHMRKKPMTTDALTCRPAAFSTRIRRTAGRIK
jgi:hypothetical protein